MADWGSLKGTPRDGGGGVDLMSLYVSRTQTPSYMLNGQVSELQFSPSPTKSPKSPHHSIFDSPAAFCRTENLEVCIAELNQELTMMSLPSLYDGHTCRYDIVRIVNCTHELLQRHQRSSRIREEIENRLHRMEADETHLRLVTSRLKVNIEQGQRELATAEECERQLLNKNKQLTSRLKAEKEEVRRLQSELSHKSAQYKHESKKREREMMKLKERLNQLLSDKCQDKKIGMEISQFIHRTDGKRATWQKGNKHEEEMYRTVISNYEERLQELLIENSGLRQFLNNMQKELAGLLDNTNLEAKPLNAELDLSDTDEEGSVASTQPESADELCEGHFQMPYEMMRDHIEKSLRERCRLLKMFIKRAVDEKDGASRQKECLTSPQNEGKDQKEIDRLTKQLNKYKEIVEQQEELIQQTLGAQDVSAQNSFLNDSNLWDDRDMLSERQAFYQQKANFAQEQRNFTEAAIRLAQERKTFEDERANFLTQQIFQMTPFQGTKTQSKTTGNYTIKDRVKSPDKNQLMPPSILFSPPPSIKGMAATPSTADLYRSLGLTSHDAINLKPRHEVSASPFLKGLSGVYSGITSTPCTGLKVVTIPQKMSSSARISVHMDNVKMALFKRDKQTTNQSGDTGTGPKSPTG